MENIAEQNGRTVLFVSHQLGVVSQLCGRGILLRDGRIVDDGLTRSVLDKYIADNRTPGGSEFGGNLTHELSVAIFRGETSNGAGLVSRDFACDEPVVLNLFLKVKDKAPIGSYLSVNLNDRVGNTITSWHYTLDYLELKLFETYYKSKFKILAGWLMPGNFTFTLAIWVPNQHVYQKIEHACPFSVHDTGGQFSALVDFEIGSISVPAEISFSEIPVNMAV